MSIVELLVAISVLGVVAAIVIPAVGNLHSGVTKTKLENDVDTVNRAIAAYLSAGGSLDGVSNPAEVLHKLKTTRSTENAWVFVGGATGSVIGERLSFRPVAERDGAVWDAREGRFKLASKGTSGSGEFYLGDPPDNRKPTEEFRDPGVFSYAKTGWIWDYENRPRETPAGPTVVPLATVPSSSIPPATALPPLPLPPPNTGPSALPDTFETPEDTPLEGVSVKSNDTDPNGDTLIVTSYTGALNGNVVIDADGTLRYSPNPDFFGTDTVAYTVDDGNGNQATASVTITVLSVNDNPVAMDDTGSTSQAVPVNLNVLANDSDVDGDALTVTSASAKNGTPIINADGTITFVPDTLYSGTETITYDISDGNGGSSSAAVEVTVFPQPLEEIDLAAWYQDAPVGGNDVWYEDSVLSVA